MTLSSLLRRDRRLLFLPSASLLLYAVYICVRIHIAKRFRKPSGPALKNLETVGKRVEGKEEIAASDLPRYDIIVVGGGKLM